MEENNFTKQSFIKRLCIFGLIVVFLLVGIWTVMNFVVHPKRSDIGDSSKSSEEQKNNKDNNLQNQTETRQMIDTQIQAANSAIAKGISIDDPQNDWYRFPAGSIQGDGRPDNSSPYPLSYTDLKNVSFGADANYAYFKFTYFGKLPGSMQTYNGDDLKFFCNNVSIGKYTDASGQSQVGMWQIGTSYIENLDKEANTEATMNYKATTPIVGLTNMGNQNGRDKNGESIWVIQNDRGIVSGGPGYDYVMAGFPLDNLGLKLGDTIEISISVENASRIYHHESVDLLLDNGNNKEGDTIQYVLGSNTYKNLGFKMEAGKD